MRRRPVVAFLCVHNSCRSQMAEALGRHLAGDVFSSVSAGTELRPCINQDAVRLMKERYSIDMEKEGQKSKLLSDIPSPDIVILMGCNVACPMVKARHTENWGLEDPSGRDDDFFFYTMDRIEENILELRDRIEKGLLDI